MTGPHQPGAIVAEGIQKSYGTVRALTGLSLSVPQGCLAGLAGPNGAGKTTFVKVLLGLTRPECGKVAVLGFDPVLAPVRN